MTLDREYCQIPNDAQADAGWHKVHLCMAGRNIVVVGASAGGFETVSKLLRPLPRELAAAVFIALNRSRILDLGGGPDAVVRGFRRSTALPTLSAKDGLPICSGTVYGAPPGSHLIVERGVMRLEVSTKESRARPSVDLLRSAALRYGRQVIGVVLTGMLNATGPQGSGRSRSVGGFRLFRIPPRISPHGA